MIALWFAETLSHKVWYLLCDIYWEENLCLGMNFRLLSTWSGPLDYSTSLKTKKSWVGVHDKRELLYSTPMSCNVIVMQDGYIPNQNLHVNWSLIFCANYKSDLRISMVDEFLTWDSQCVYLLMMYFGYLKSGCVACVKMSLECA